MAEEASHSPPFAPGDQLVDQVSRLDRSHDTFDSSLGEILQLLNIPKAGVNSFPPFQGLEEDSTRGISPLHEWAAKWLLKRMMMNTADNKGPALDHRAWCLLLRLIPRLRLKFLAQLFVDFKLSTTLKWTLKCLGQQAELWSELTTLSERFEFPKSKSQKQEKTGIRLRSLQGLKNTLRCVTGFLRFVEVGLLRRMDQSTTLDREHLRQSLQLRTEDAMEVLGNFLTAMRIIEFPTTVFTQETVNKQLTYLRPVLFLWHSRSKPADHGAEFSEAYQFLLHCLLPSLCILPSRGVLEGEVADEVEALVATHYLVPSFNAYCQRPTPSSETTQLPLSLKEVFKPLTLARQRDYIVFLRYEGAYWESGPQASDFYDVYERPREQALDIDTLELPFVGDLLALVLRLAIRFQGRDKHQIGSAHASWLSHLFSELASCVHIDIEGSGSSPSPEARLVLCHMLKVCVELGVSPRSELLKSAAFGFCKALRVRKTSEFWQGLCDCVKLDCSIVMGDTLPEAPASRSPLLQDILDTVSLEPDTQGEKWVCPTSVADLIWPLIDGYAQSREMTRWIAIWRGELSKTFAAVAEYPDVHCECPPFSFAWSDERICRGMAPKVVAALTQSQMRALFHELADLLHQDGSQQDYARSLWALAVVTQCLLSTPWDESLEEALVEPARQIYNRGAKVMSEDLPKRVKARFWQFLTSACDKWPATRLGEHASDGKGSLLEYAKMNIRAQLDKDSAFVDFTENELSSSCWSYLTALGSSVSLTGEEPHKDYVGIFQGLMMQILEKNALLCTPSPCYNSFERVSLVWDGTVSRIFDLEMLLYTLLAIAFVREPCLELLDETALHNFVSGLFVMALCDSGDSPFESAVSRAPWRTLWYTVNDVASAGESSKLADHVRQINLSAIFTDETSPATRDEGLHVAHAKNFALVSLKNVGPSALTKNDRVKLADNIWDLLKSQGSLEAWPMLASILVRIMRPYKKSMKMLRDSHSLSALATEMNELPFEALQTCLPSLRAVAVELSTYAVSTTSEGCVDYLKKFRKNLSNMVKCGNFHNPPVATWFVASVSLNALSMIPTKHAESDFGVRQDLLRRMIQALSLCRLFPTEHAGWGPSLVEAVGDLSDLLPTLPAKITIPYSSLASSELGKCTLVDEDVDVGTLFQSLEADWSYWVKSRSSDDIDTLSRALVALRRIVNCVNRDEAFIPVEEVVDGLQSFRTAEGYVQQVAALAGEFRRMDHGVKARYLEELVPARGLLEAGHRYFLLIRAVFSVPFEPDERSEEVRMVLGQCLNTLHTCLISGNQVESPSEAIYATENLIRKNAWAVTQWHVDSLLSTISIKTSRAAPSSPGEQPGRTFSSLCQMFQSILAAHRPRINGRYAMAVDALNGLLRCLFLPYNSQAAGPGIDQPPWLTSATAESRLKIRVDERYALRDTHARSFARLLSALCDPAPGAVKLPRGNADVPRHERQLLNDGIKKARAIAGQHLQYVVAEFCTLQLRGRLEPEVRSALNPGLYAVFDAMSVEVQRTVNGALDEQARAIFKSVYDDYARFGKWEGA